MHRQECNSCQSSKKACKVDGVSIHVPRSTKQVANSVIAVEEGSNTTVVEGFKVAALAGDYLELAKKVHGFEGLIVGLYNAAINDQELMPVLCEYVADRQQDNRGKAQQTHLRGIQSGLTVPSATDQSIRPQGKSCNLSKLVLTRSRLLKIVTAHWTQR
jgi:hypothetical protein